MRKKMLSVALILVITFSLSGCVADIDGRYEGLSIGFNFTGPRYYEIMSAVKSNKTEFDADAVTLDLYFGWFREPPLYADTVYENDYPICIAFYITTNEVGRWTDPQNDYHDVENQYFLTEVPAEEFITEAFAASQTLSKGKVFNHSEKIIIPKEAFNPRQVTLVLYAYMIWFSNADGLYHFGDYTSNRVKIAYEYLNDNTVLLYK